MPADSLPRPVPGSRLHSSALPVPARGVSVAARVTPDDVRAVPGGGVPERATTDVGTGRERSDPAEPTRGRSGSDPIGGIVPSGDWLNSPSLEHMNY